MRAVCALALIVAALLGTGRTSAQTADDVVIVSLARALEARITVWRSPDGRILHASHCRLAREGCRARLALFARWIVEVASERTIDPWTLAAVAVRESGLDPFAVGRAGEHGIVQLHPQGIGRGVRFVSSETYRARCVREPGACQREVLEVGAQHVADAITMCEGDVASGLGAYNRGECGETTYARRVLSERALLVSLANGRPVPAGRGARTRG
jgi:hypothetical protein